MTTPRKFKGILFDLDGTLVDTAPDLAAALNSVLISENLSPLDFDQIRHVASDGAKGLLELGFNITEKDSRYHELRKRFIHYYTNHIAVRSVLFHGMEEILQLIETRQIPWGIVTNKPTALTQKLLQALNLTKRTLCVVCGDTLKERKPHPAPLLHAAQLLHLSPEDCCYVGDAERDNEAAKAANMPFVLAMYGYLHEKTRPEDFQADYVIHSPLDLRTIL